MSASTLIPESVVYTQQITSRAVESVKTKIDRGLVRYNAFFLVMVAVILALGATLLAGMAVWCVVYQGKRFTGAWHWNSGWDVYVECV